MSVELGTQLKLYKNSLIKFKYNYSTVLQLSS